MQLDRQCIHKTFFRSKEHCKHSHPISMTVMTVFTNQHIDLIPDLLYCLTVLPTNLNNY